MSASPSGAAQSAERPERSRNAKAQARHRAKRKAYIEQLETTVTKLQTTMGYTPEDVAAMPPPLMKIRELEQEVARLLKENDELRRMLGDPQGGRYDTRRSLGSYTPSCGEREYNGLKRRKTEDMYGNGSDTPPQTHNGELTRLTIPHQPAPHHHYSQSHHSTPATATSHATMFSLPTGGHQGAFRLNPPTPSGGSSSATSSPPFSASLFPSQSPLPLPKQLHDTRSYAPPPLSSYPSPSPSC